MNRSKKYEFSPENRNLLESLQHPLAAYQLIDDKICTLLISDGMCHMCAMDRDSIIELFNTDMYRGTHPDDVARVAELAHRFIINENEYGYRPLTIITKSKSFFGSDVTVSNISARNSGDTTTGSNPLLRELPLKMSAKKLLTTTRNPYPEIAHAACSRLDPLPKFFPATRIWPE